MPSLSKVKKVFKEKAGRQSVVLPLKNPPEEILDAIKQYIDKVQDGYEYPHVEFNNDYSKIRIYSLWTE